MPDIKKQLLGMAARLDTVEEQINKILEGLSNEQVKTITGGLSETGRARLLRRRGKPRNKK